MPNTGYAGRAIKIAGGESTSVKGKGKGKAKAVSEDCTSEDKGGGAGREGMRGTQGCK